jgi:hypothetical protein
MNGNQQLKPSTHAHSCAPSSAHPFSTMHFVFTNLNKKFIADLEQQCSDQDTVRRLILWYQCYI